MGFRKLGLEIGFVVLTILAVSPVAAFPIKNYVTVMEIQPDSSINVTEEITADFTGDPHHGIYRDIPLTGKDNWGNNYRLRLEDVRVTDRAGYPLQTLKKYRYGNLHLRIGDPNVLVSDVRTYVIRYRLWRAVHFFSDHDEIYWNAVGTDWEVPILNASCIVRLPKDAPHGSIRAKSYTGYYGETGTAAVYDILDNRTVRFWMTKPLSPREAMTVIVGWPKEIVNPPPFKQEAIWFVTDNGYFFLVPIFVIALFVYWLRVGADPDTGRSEVVTFDPPDNLIPAELGTLIDERVDMRDISASIVDLAVKGFLTIKEKAQRGFLGTTRDYTLELTKPFQEVVNDPSLTPFESSLIHGLFEGKQFCVISALKHQFYTHIPKLQRTLYSSMVKHGYFKRSPEAVRKTYQGIAIAIIVLGGILFIVSLAEEMPVLVPTGWGVSVAICGLILAFTARAMPRKTRKGKDVLIAARGFEEYLSRAERELIEHQERQNYFEKFLPYAMA
ncbi:MAG: DUF2207 domain-containing protein, partial [Armatimonadetes bacterium]|nr:DUF2207 domain-containing protein [Armatimonadota bacterium]